MELDNEDKGEGKSYTTEFRQYDPRLGRWLSLDPLMAQFPWMSPYVAFDNNPVWKIDPKGSEAWPVVNAWNQSYINEYNKFVLVAAKAFEIWDIEFSCEDLALEILIIFAHNNNLPLTIINDDGTYNQENWSDYDSYKNNVLRATSANDLAKHKNVVEIGNSFEIIKEAQEGNLLLLKLKTTKYKHVQVVTYNDKKHNKVYIRQGNLNKSLSANPSNLFYGGLNQERGVYNMNRTDSDKNGYYFNFHTGNKEENIIKELQPTLVNGISRCLMTKVFHQKDRGKLMTLWILRSRNREK